jgi:hypothetical protein
MGMLMRQNYIYNCWGKGVTVSFPCYGLAGWVVEFISIILGRGHAEARNVITSTDTAEKGLYGFIYVVDFLTFLRFKYHCRRGLLGWLGSVVWRV